MYAYKEKQYEHDHVKSKGVTLLRSENFLYVRSGGQQMDFVAFGLIMILTVLLMWGMREAKTVNNSEFTSHFNTVDLRP